MFARGPEDFRNSGNVGQPNIFARAQARLGSTPAVVHRGFRAEMPLMEIPHLTGTSEIQDPGPQIIQQIVRTKPGELIFAIVQCSLQPDEGHLVGIPLLKLSLLKSVKTGYPLYGRCKPLVLIPWEAVPQDFDAMHRVVHVDSHWINDWCFNKPVYPTF